MNYSDMMRKSIFDEFEKCIYELHKKYGISKEEIISLCISYLDNNRNNCCDAINIPYSENIDWIERMNKCVVGDCCDMNCKEEYEKYNMTCLYLTKLLVDGK